MPKTVKKYYRKHGMKKTLMKLDCSEAWERLVFHTKELQRAVDRNEKDAGNEYMSRLGALYNCQNIIELNWNDKVTDRPVLKTIK